MLEAADDVGNSVLDVWSVPGDGMVLVNRFGERVVDEKREYQTRGRAHHVFEHDEYPNRVLFLVYDERTATRFGGRYPIPAPGAVAGHVVSGTGIEGLTDVLGRAGDTRSLGHAAGHRPGRARRSPPATADDTWSASTRWPRPGVDDDFGRGTKAVEHAFHGPRARDNHLPNALLHPLAIDGRLFAILLVGAAFETNSGPRTTPRDRCSA